VAHHQVRNVGTLSGNLMMAHAHEGFASDLATIFLAAGAILTCGAAQTRGETQRVSVTKFFGLEQKGLVIEEVFLPVFGAGEKLVTQKVALRRQNAHALVNMGLRAAVDSDGEGSGF
jgi:CO/xanthine dehydrogenase FAD-binding subunit